MLKDYIVISVRSLSKRKLRSWLTMIGIFIGIAAVVSLIGLGEGLRSAVISQFSFIGSDVLSIQASGLSFAGPPGTGTVAPLIDELADKISKVNGVEAAFNRYIESTKMEFNNKQTIGFTGSVPEGEDRKVFEQMVNLKVKEGRLLKDNDGKKVILGNNFLKYGMFGKRVKVGDSVLLNGGLLGMLF